MLPKWAMSAPAPGALTGSLPMLHWNPTDATLSFDTRLSPLMPEARDLVQRARQLLPSIGEVEPEAVRIAIRPIPGDQLSAIGPMPRTSGYYIVTTHSGVTMSPFLGAVVADEIPIGSPETPLTNAQLEAKFRDCARNAAQPLSDAGLDGLLSAIGRLETLPDARELMTPFAG
jgi:glycine/D-amino acid oxidase-like deaminating enzyme